MSGSDTDSEATQYDAYDSPNSTSSERTVAHYADYLSLPDPDRQWSGTINHPYITAVLAMFGDTQVATWALVLDCYLVPFAFRDFPNSDGPFKYAWQWKIEEFTGRYVMTQNQWGSDVLPYRGFVDGDGWPTGAPEQQRVNEAKLGHRVMERMYRGQGMSVTEINTCLFEESANIWATVRSRWPVAGLPHSQPTFTLVSKHCPHATKLLCVEAYNLSGLTISRYKALLGRTRSIIERQDRGERLIACSDLYRECRRRLVQLQSISSQRADEERKQRMFMIRAVDAAGSRYAMDYAVCRQAKDHIEMHCPDANGYRNRLNYNRRPPAP